MSKPRVIPGLDEVMRRQIYTHCFSALDREVGGVLVGTTQRGAPPHVEAAIPALRASENPAQLTFTQDAWEDIHRELEEKYPTQKIIGWYHTHPGYGLFLSQQDLFIHQNFFKNRNQIAVVVDPVAGEEAVFAWAGGEVREYYRRPTEFEPAAGRRAAERGPEVSEIRSSALSAPDSSTSLAATTRLRGLSAFEAPPLTTWIYLAIIGLSAGTIVWELALK